MDFTDFGLNEALLKALDAMDITLPTAVQEQAMPLILEGRNCIVTAQTGTGKTLAYMLPALHKLLQDKEREAAQPRVLIMSPTRELARQIFKAFRDLSIASELKGACVYGGQDIRLQQEQMVEGVDVLIATPGRLHDLLKNSDLSLGDLDILVLDEADMMLDMGFRKDIKQVVALGPKNMQTLFFTATLPDMVSDMAYDLLSAPEEINVSPNRTMVKKIAQKLYHVTKPKKVELCLYLLRKEIEGNCIIFCRTKQGVDRLTATLLKNQMSVVALHGDLTQKQRETALEQFRNGEAQYLVATDLASRGIDVSFLDNVLNYDMPHIPETYIHRVGRTGRAEQSGKAYSLCSPDEKSYVLAIQRMLHAPIEIDENHPFLEQSAQKKVKASPAPKPEKKKSNRSGKKGRSSGSKGTGTSFKGRKAGGGSKHRRR